MSTPTLVPCNACGRHVRAAEPRCPFCEAPTPCDGQTGPAVVPDPSVRLGRAALFVFGASLTVASAPGCNTLDRMLHGDRGGSGTSRQQVETIAQPYGAPPQYDVDAGGPTPEDAAAADVPVPLPPREHPAMASHYGGPPWRDRYGHRPGSDGRLNPDPIDPTGAHGTDPAPRRR